MSPARSALPDLHALADLCLGHLAEQPEALAAFLAESGYSGKALLAARGSDELAHGLIDHFARNEPLLLSLCANGGLAPETFMAVWARHNQAM